MPLVSISDIHVKSPQDERYQLLLKFLNHEVTQKADQIFLLGDIFDLMVGPHPEYFDIYPEFFTSLTNLVRKNKIVHYFEGNHDLHIKKLFLNLLKKENMSDKLLQFHSGPWTYAIHGKNYYFSHGDELEPGNYSYKIYKKILMSKPMELVISEVAPFKLVDYIGTNASKLSRSKGKRTYNEEKNRQKFRQGAIEKAHGQYEFIIAGHSHIQENIELKGREKSFRYVNNGFLPQSRSFISIDHHEVKFISLV